MPDRRPPRRTAAAPATVAGREPRTCAVCGRTITWRAAWARDWDQVRYCSGGCRSRGLTDTDAALERTTLALLDARARQATICPSEVARAVAGPGADEAAWRHLMEPARMAARRLVAAGQVQVTQGGQVVDPSTAKGAIRLRRAR